ncbi:MAG: glucose-6-phosphate isomerase [Proteobacteria bacterium]|nr:glucose-6-phosphate isomerase [Pseudomonadota bacterium]
MPLIFDFTNLLTGGVGEKAGISEEEIKKFAGPAEKIVQEAEAKRLPFRELPYRDEYAKSVNSLAGECAGRFSTQVNLGIGGSSLGGNALVSALAGSGGNHREASVFFPENVDPDSFSRMLNSLDLEKTIFSVVSKSGSTAETIAQFLVVRDRLVSRFGPGGYRERVVAITDPNKGDLRRLAEEDGLRTLPFPDGVGGRFSVLCPVGLFPAAMAGIDIGEVLAGAREMDKRCRSTDPFQNPALLFAILLFLSSRKGRGMVIFWPYSDLLIPAADWFRQLWAESLGKRNSIGGGVVHAGQTPVRAVGVTDQHSQLQLYIEGPVDKVICFLAVNDYRTVVEIPDAGINLPSFSYLQGKTLNSLIRAEQEATEMSLTQAGRPNCKLVFPRLSAAHLGEYFYLLEVATAFAGALFQIDPFDQPGVEEGKKLTFGMMGREGYEEKRKEFLEWRKRPGKIV